MSGKHDLAGEGPSCPCCVERLSITGIPTKVFKSKEADGEWTCEVCATPVPDTVLLKHTELDLPPFEWPTSAKQIQEDAAKVIEAATANLAAVAAVPDDAVSFGASPSPPPPADATAHSDLLLLGCGRRQTTSSGR